VKLKFCIFGLFAALGTLVGMPEIELDEVGFRAGVDDETGENFHSYELVAYLETPWEWDLGDSVELDLEMEASAGLLEGNSKTAGLLHLGFAAFLEVDDLPLRLVLSTGPTYLSEDEYEDFNLGGHLQFTSAVGFDCELVDDWTAGYRYQHISNAGLDDLNPGLNMHLLAIAHDF